MAFSDTLSLDEFHVTSNRIADTSTYGDIKHNILGPLADLVRAETSIFGIVQKDDGHHIRAGNFISRNIQPTCLHSYARNFQSDDPVLPHAFNTTRLRNRLNGSKCFTFTLDHIIDPSQFSRGQYYNEFLRPNSIHQVLALGIPTPLDSSMIYIIGLHRYCHRPFTETDARKISLLGPSLYMAFHNLHLKERLDDQTMIVSAIGTEPTEQGLVILNENDEVIFANPAGRTHLEHNHLKPAIGVQETQKGRIIPGEPLRDMLRRHQEKEALIPNRRAKTHLEIGDITIEVETLRPPTNPGARRLLLRTCKKAPAAVAASAIDRFGLSKRETDIASLVVMGATNTAISETLCISVRTVENHLRSIYQKVGVRNRTSLAFHLSPSA
ncbi:helix-turn-helix transcriptional regulator [Luteithermobacter gelatinilyticus]|uniref:helix-turn-helix transcriptional regulator n=1 Tax=Luteithermobacter gelatinilyticus TaxID=2582913 RepID=UPI001107014F|nr:helix-turn-helix transcriptional regulator [Luteithermobacter gelatinilyticus]